MCMKIQPAQVKMIIKLISLYMEKAPEFLELLKTIVKDDISGMILRRNQIIVAKAIMGAPKVIIKDMESAKEERLEDHMHYIYYTIILKYWLLILSHIYV